MAMLPQAPAVTSTPGKAEVREGVASRRQNWKGKGKNGGRIQQEVWIWWKHTPGSGGPGHPELVRNLTSFFSFTVCNALLLYSVLKHTIYEKGRFMF